jgi:hypothetical protein
MTKILLVFTLETVAAIKTHRRKPTTAELLCGGEKIPFSNNKYFIPDQYFDKK